MKEYRIKEVFQDYTVTYVPQERLSLFFGLVKYWSYFPHYDWHQTFLTYQDAVKFLDNIESLSKTGVNIKPYNRK